MFMPGSSVFTPKPPAPFSIDKGLEIPSIPLVLIKIIQTLDADTSSAKALETLISHDPALVARILRLANSAFYSFRATVKTISHAVSLLGMNLVTSLAIGINVFDTFTKGLKSESALISKLWTHSCGVGVLTKEFWAFNRQNSKDGEFAFLCGLLHDLGKVVLFKTYPNHYGSFYAIAKTEADPPISAYEVENYGMDHAAIGELLAKQWGFPPELSSIIGKHHDASALPDPIVRAVMAADLLVKEFGVGYDGDDGKSEDQAAFRRQLNLSEEECEHLADYLSRERANIEGFFRISKSESRL
jgi:HD-like signal output (HDOD) protein